MGDRCTVLTRTFDVRGGLTQAGKLLVIDLLEHCPDFIDKICHAKNKGVFPIELFLPDRCTTLGCSKGVFVRAKGDKSPKVAPGFGVVVLAAQSKGVHACPPPFPPGLRACVPLLHCPLASRSRSERAWGDAERVLGCNPTR